MASSLFLKLPIRRLRTLSSSFPLLEASTYPLRAVLRPTVHLLPISRVSYFSSAPTSNSDGAQGPAPIDYRSILAEDEFHKLADETLHELQEKFEEYGDEIQLDGFDIDYGNHVLTLKLGDMGTYVINKQTPNRQVWLSSPVSGPSRFDWDVESKSWVYRRTKANMLRLLEEELAKLCGRQISLS